MSDKIIPNIKELVTSIRQITTITNKPQILSIRNSKDECYHHFLINRLETIDVVDTHHRLYSPLHEFINVKKHSTEEAIKLIQELLQTIANY